MPEQHSSGIRRPHTHPHSSWIKAATPFPREPWVSSLPGMLGSISVFVSHSSIPEHNGDSGKAGVASPLHRGGLRQPHPLGP